MFKKRDCTDTSDLQNIMDKMFYLPLLLLYGINKCVARTSLYGMMKSSEVKDAELDL